MMALNVGDAPDALKAAALAMKRADATVRKDVSQRMRETMGPAWKSEVTAAAAGRSAQIFVPGTRIAAGNPPQLVAASSRRKLGRGLIPDKHWAGYEYGATDQTRRQKSRSGHTYKRHVMRHLPARSAGGHTLGKAAAEILPRVAAYWAQSVVKSFMDAADEGGN